MELEVFNGFGQENRFFVPLIKPETPIPVIQEICRQTKNIAFNYQKILTSSRERRKEIRRQSFHDYFDIPSRVKVWLTTNAPDSFIEKHFAEGLDKFKRDIQCFRPDYFMSPDWSMYDEYSLKQQNDSLNKQIELTLACSDLDGLIPSTNAVSVSQEIKFIKEFQVSGYNTFIIPGREHLMHNKRKKRNENRLLTKIENAVNETKAKIIVTGTSSPRQHKLLYPAKGFIGLNWQLQADYRRLLQGFRFCSILKEPFRNFICKNEFCCNGETACSLAGKEKTVQRYLHNLIGIQEFLKQKPEQISSIQTTLEVFKWAEYQKQVIGAISIPIRNRL